MQFNIASSDPALLEKARRIAGQFAAQYRTDAVVGIALLGAVVRGYFDRFADIDVAVFRKRGTDVPFAGQYQHVGGIEIHCHLSDYEEEAASEWSMAKRWTFSNAEMVYDPQGLLASLLRDKVPLQADERRWLLMSGLALSEWYINRLTELWVERGSVTAAHQMLGRGLDYFLDMLFGLNGELVADAKWKHYCAERLPRLPAGFHEQMQAAMLLKDFSLEDLQRRKEAFMTMWHEVLPVIEADLGMSYAEIMDIV
jgi:hypothetical protein